MRIIIEVEDRAGQSVQTLAEPGKVDKIEVVDAGASPQGLAPFVTAEATGTAQPVNRLNGGSPPEWLLQAIAEATSPSQAATSEAVDAGAAPSA